MIVEILEIWLTPSLLILAWALWPDGWRLRSPPEPRFPRVIDRDPAVRR
jgi:hypothetical protein